MVEGLRFMTGTVNLMEWILPFLGVRSYAGMGLDVLLRSNNTTLFHHPVNPAKLTEFRIPGNEVIHFEVGVEGVTMLNHLVYR